MSEYERDREDSVWFFGGQEASYSAIFNYLSSQAREQRLADEKAWETEALVSSIHQFVNLDTIYLSFVDGIQSPFQWFAGCVCLGGMHTLSDYLLEMAAAMAVAQLDGVGIKMFEISGFYSRIDLADPFLLGLMSDALSDVCNLRVINSPTMLEFLCRTPLPSIQRFELANCWLSVNDLEDFVRKNANSLCSLHLEDTWLLQEKINENGIYLSMANAKSIFDNIIGIWDSGILDELTINRRLGGLYEVQELFPKAD